MKSFLLMAILSCSSNHPPMTEHAVESGGEMPMLEKRPTGEGLPAQAIHHGSKEVCYVNPVKKCAAGHLPQECAALYNVKVCK